MTGGADGDRRGTAIVTGGGGAAGRAIARRLAGDGFDVVVAGRSAPALEAACRAITDEGGTAHSVPTDVTDAAQVAALRRRAEELAGPANVLVCNAGQLRAIGPLWEIEPTDWYRDIDVNLNGTFLCVREFVPGMVERRAGRVINVSSLSAVESSPYNSAYAAAKAGVTRLTEGLAVSLAGTGVCAFAITPGLVRSEMTEYLITSPPGRRWMSDFDDPQAEWVPPERAASLVSALACGSGDALSGRFLLIDDDVEALSSQIGQDESRTMRLVL